MELKNKNSILPHTAKHDRQAYVSAFSLVSESDSYPPSQRPPMLRERLLNLTVWLLSFYGFNLEKILLRISGLDARLVAKFLAHIKFQKIRLTDLNTIRPFVVTADYTLLSTQLDSLHFAKTFRPKN